MFDLVEIRFIEIRFIKNVAKWSTTPISYWNFLQSEIGLFIPNLKPNLSFYPVGVHNVHCASLPLEQAGPKSMPKDTSYTPSSFYVASSKP